MKDHIEYQAEGTLAASKTGSTSVKIMSQVMTGMSE